ncbi:MAG: 3-oxoacyl-[acyl-carrier-protein] synthase 2 [Bacillota bacterium]
MQRVVITGAGVISPLSSQKEEFWAKLAAGESGIGELTAFDTDQYEVKIAGEVRDFDPTLYMARKDSKRMDRFAQFAVAAAKKAVADAKISLNGDETAVYIGAGIGGLQTIEEQHSCLLAKGPRRVSPFFIPMLIGNMAAGQVALQLGLKGPNFSIVSACSTGTHAIGEAMRLLQRKEVNVVLAGGAEATILPMAVAGFSAMGALATGYNDRPQEASRPFEKNRSGFVMSEGAGVLVLERLEHALARGAHIMAELAGYGASCDAYHLTAPDKDGTGAVRSMSLAIKDAGLQPADVDYINAHGTATKYNDALETLAIKKLFKDHAYKLAINSIKSMLGHLLGASGAVEAISTALTLERGLIPPTINYQEQDPECDLNYTPNVAKKSEVKVAISNSFGFGGHNATVLLRKFN